MTHLKPCPCGETPKDLEISSTIVYPRLATACGTCCYKWGVEFDVPSEHKYFGDTKENIAAATAAWNKAPRRGTPERYTKDDWDALDDAQKLVDEREKEGGTK